MKSAAHLIPSITTILLLGVFIPSGILEGQTAQQPTDWSAWQFLIGDWVGEGTGDPGQGEGGFTFSLDLQNRILVRRNFAGYPATKNRPAFRHDDPIIIFQEPGGLTKADYFDNEGHTIHYAVAFANDSNSIVFSGPKSDSEPRYRLTYSKLEGGLLSITFEIAPPGKSEAFQQYIKASARRKSRR